jgi:hypothetical protein
MMLVTDWFRMGSTWNYLDLPQLSPFGLVCTEWANAVDLGCLRHCEGTSRACGPGECGIEMIYTTEKTHELPQWLKCCNEWFKRVVGDISMS